ncbi:MAG: YraN family protein [Candidatus Falkowbacteria bacterium]|nr:MAG: YraN family protein [Candidatus Falkowbacteria bacterium]
MDKLTTGHLGENLACNYLKSQNYQILERNFHLGRLELDIIAAKNGQLFLLEIKTRGCPQRPDSEALISKKQIANLKKAAKHYAALKQINFNLVHFDLILVTIDRQKSSAKIKHYLDIF